GRSVAGRSGRGRVLHPVASAESHLASDPISDGGSFRVVDRRARDGSGGRGNVPVPKGRPVAGGVMLLRARSWLTGTATRLVLHPFPINLASFFILSLVAFRDNAPYLFYAYDGQFHVSLITLDRLFVPLQIGLTN